MPRRLLLGSLLALAVALPACGGAQRAPAPAGRTLFASACGSCHTLSGHDDSRHQGGDLRTFHATHAQLLQFAAEMPVRRPLDQRQLEAIVQYVMKIETSGS